jgi:hypothetical protein
MNYFNEYNHIKQVNSLLKAYILSKTVNCATRIQNSSTAIDNIVTYLRYAGHLPCSGDVTALEPLPLLQ